MFGISFRKLCGLACIILEFNNLYLTNCRHDRKSPLHILPLTRALTSIRYLKPFKSYSPYGYSANFKQVSAVVSAK